MSDESWIEYGSKLTGEIAAKLLLNTVKPGLGSVVDFALAVRDYRDGNYAGAGVNAVSGALEIGTPGMSSAWKGFAQESGKKALIGAAKEKAKTDGKKLVGKQVAKSLAEGGIEQTVNEVFSANTKATLNNMAKSAALSSISSGGRDVGKTVFEDTLQYLSESALEHVLEGGVKKNVQNFPCEWMKEAAKRAIEEEYLEYYVVKNSLEFGGSVYKGMINHSFNAPSHAFEREPGNTLSNYASDEGWKSSQSLNSQEQIHSLSGTLEREPAVFSLNHPSNYATDEGRKSSHSTESLYSQEQIQTFSWDTSGTLEREPAVFSLNHPSNYAPDEGWKSSQEQSHNYSPGTLEREPAISSLNQLSNYARDEGWKSPHSTESLNSQEQINNSLSGTLEREPAVFSLNHPSNYATDEGRKSSHSTESLYSEEQIHTFSYDTFGRKPAVFSLNHSSNYAPDEGWKSSQEQSRNYSPGTLEMEPAIFSLNQLSNDAPDEGWKSFRLTPNFLNFP